MINIPTIIEDLEEIMNDFLKVNNINASFEHDFSDPTFYNDINVICMDITDTNNSKLFMKSCQMAGLDRQVPSYIMAFLHEAGHACMNPSITKRQWHKYDLMIRRFQSKNRIASKKDNMKYFKTDVERAATTWAVNFVKNNFKQIQELTNKLEEIGIL